LIREPQGKEEEREDGVGMLDFYAYEKLFKKSE
jgi:hypothetical protein